MASAIFRIGFSRIVVEKKWPVMRTAFAGFADRIAGFGPAQVQRLMADSAMIRNEPKILAVIQNARCLRAVRREFGSCERYISRVLRAQGEAGLLEDLGRRFVRLGPKTALVFLRMTGHEMPETMSRLSGAGN